MLSGFAKAKARINYPVGKLFFPVFRFFLMEIAQDFAHQIIVMRIFLHGAGIAFFVHRHVSNLIVDHCLEHFWIIVTRCDVVDHIDAQSNASQGHRAVIGINAQPRLRECLSHRSHHRRYTVQFFCKRNALTARTGTLSANVHNRSASLKHRPSSIYRLLNRLYATFTIK